MPTSDPVVYVLNGEDEFAIAQFLASLEARLGDASLAGMNITLLDGRTLNIAELPAVTNAMPFLASRRLVVLTNPLARLNSPTARKQFTSILENIPPTTILALVEYRTLTERKGSQHWLEKWADGQPERAAVKTFPLPKGAAMVQWIQGQVKTSGGQMKPQAAALLANLVGDDPRMAGQEIQKLLAYVNYSRPVEPEDVEAVTADSSPGDIFKMVDALAVRNSHLAQGMLHRLLETEEPILIFGMVIRQFRLLLLTREVMDAGSYGPEIARQLKVHPYVADKVSGQARQFSLPMLEAVYRRLLDLDEEIKTGQIGADLALDTLVAGFTSM